MSQILQSSHQDYIRDIAFDHYGRRIATCSGDRTVKIWDLDENSQWTSSTEGFERVHLNGVTSLSWAHPEFGQLLATSGSEGFAIIWEERSNFSSSTGDQQLAGFSGAKRWQDRATLTDSNKKALSCVKFAPRHLRLQLATASADGNVRIYEAVDVMNLSLWSLKNTIKVVADSASDLGVTCLDWCTGRFERAFVVGDYTGNINIYQADKSENWKSCFKLEGHLNPTPGVLDVAWSPDVGRSYHLISSCGRDHKLRVHRLKKNFDGRGSLSSESSEVLDDESDTWRCEWNVTGTVLASSGDGGLVKLWKSNYEGTWSCVTDVSG